jgi:hypothetical protein
MMANPLSVSPDQINNIEVTPENVQQVENQLKQWSNTITPYANEIFDPYGKEHGGESNRTALGAYLHSLSQSVASIGTGSYWNWNSDPNKVIPSVSPSGSYNDLDQDSKYAASQIAAIKSKYDEVNKLKRQMQAKPSQSIINTLNLSADPEARQLGVTPDKYDEYKKVGAGGWLYEQIINDWTNVLRSLVNGASVDMQSFNDMMSKLKNVNGETITYGRSHWPSDKITMENMVNG